MDICELAGQYALSFKTLKAEWYYVEPKGEAGDGSLTAAATAKEALGEITAKAIEGLEDRRAFWINIYNGAVIERAIEVGVEESVKEVRGFFRGKWLELAGERLSLDDIEHGFLRDNRRHPAGLLPALWARSRLQSWIARPFDARIHFALNCGAQSCPPIGVYSDARIEAQLDLAAETFLTAEVEVLPERNAIRAHRILRWYRGDFAGLGGLEGLLRRYRGEQLKERAWRFVWQPYDWSI